MRTTLFTRRRLAAGCWSLALLCAAGCVPANYEFGSFSGRSRAELAAREVPIHVGTPSPRLRRLRHVVETPLRVLPMKSPHRRHELSPATAARLTAYLRENDLTDVYVSVNDYDPAAEWQRLRDNHRVSPVWRYSLGVFSFIGYTLLPAPVFGGNSYNSYTNHLTLELDEPAQVLHAAALAKVSYEQSWPGTYAATSSLPGLSFFKQSRTTGDVVAYARTTGDWEVEQAAYRSLYPRLGAESTVVAMPLVTVWWVAPALGLSGSLAGRGVGRAIESRRIREREDASAVNVRDTITDRTVGPEPAANRVGNRPATELDTSPIDLAWRPVFTEDADGWAAFNLAAEPTRTDWR